MSDSKHSATQFGRIRAAERILVDEYETVKEDFDRCLTNCLTATERQQIDEVCERCILAVWRLRELLAHGTIPPDVEAKLSGWDNGC